MQIESGWYSFSLSYPVSFVHPVPACVVLSVVFFAFPFNHAKVLSHPLFYHILLGKYKIGAAIYFQHQKHRWNYRIKGKNRVCTNLISLKVNILYDNLYSSTQLLEGNSKLYFRYRLTFVLFSIKMIPNGFNNVEFWFGSRTP